MHRAVCQRATPHASSHAPESFCVLRAPLLAFDELLTWADRGRGGGVEALRRHLRERLEAPALREALALASPSLLASVPQWIAAPETKAGRKTERALVRYFQRMAGRATPFGLFAGCSLGQLGADTELRLAAAEDAQVVAELDFEVLGEITRALGSDPRLRRGLRHRANSTLYRTGDGWRFVELDEDGAPALAEVEAGPELDAVIEAARAGAEFSALVERLAGLGSSMEEGAGFVDALIEGGILIPELDPRLTGERALPGLITELRGAGAGAELLGPLERCAEALAAPTRPGQGAARERVVREALAGLRGAPGPGARALRVTISRPAPKLRLGRDLCDALDEGVEALRRMARGGDSGLDRFRAVFRARYGGREVPLLEVLDDDLGVGLGVPGSFDDAGDTPLLDGLEINPPQPVPEAWGPREAWLLRRVEDWIRAGSEGEVELGGADLDALASEDPPRLPEAYAVLATVLDGGQRDGAQILLKSVTGPSGARMLGRLCDADDELRAAVEGHLRREEQLRPDALFAEVVYASDGRVANISRRPCLRRYELPYLGRSGAPAERQIALDDLRVALVGERVVLRSARLAREIVPRSTTAHNREHPRALRAYRFLRLVETQGTTPSLAWDWGALAEFARLPRVRVGRVVLTRARWRLGRAGLDGLAAARGRADALARWRAERGIPRFVALRDGDNELPVDFDNPLSVDAFAHLVAQREDAVLIEIAGAPDELCARDAGGGRFVHELVIPFVKRDRDPVFAPEPARGARPAAAITRSFAPGSRWLSAKIYCGQGLADRVLVDLVGPWIDSARSQGATRWHFLRYADPSWHLRVRVEGDPALIHDPLLAELHGRCEQARVRGLIWWLSLDSYEREIERYGGPESIELVEGIFEADSDAVLADITRIVDADETLRWQLVLAGIDRLVTDLGFSLTDKLALATAMRAAYGREFGAERGALRHQLGRSYRAHRASVEALLARGPGPGDRRIRAAATELGALAEAGRLSQARLDIAASLVHIHAVRALRSDPREHELVIHEFLVRAYRARLHRERAGTGAKGAGGARARRSA